MLILRSVDAGGSVRHEATGDDEVFVAMTAPHSSGQVISVETEPGTFVVVCLDASLPASLLFLPEGHFDFPVPLSDGGQGYAPGAFAGARPRAWARLARPEEISARRDLALNPHDHADSRAFPHAASNAHTRGEPGFAARCAVDGEMANDDHGRWPWTSWGIAQNPEAALTVTFGRHVQIEEIALTLRADFPHDGWWRQATIDFGDGDRIALPLEKSGARQIFPIGKRQVTQLVLQDLIPSDDPSPFPALTRIEVMGGEAGGD